MESWTVRYFEENKDYCLEKLKDRKFWEQVRLFALALNSSFLLCFLSFHIHLQVPLLNHITECEPYNNKLIRFKGMIQDILNPIYYIEQFHVVNTKTSVTSVRSGKYRDRIDLSVSTNFDIYYWFVRLFYETRSFICRMMKKFCRIPTTKSIKRSISCVVFKYQDSIRGPKK